MQTLRTSGFSACSRAVLMLAAAESDSRQLVREGAAYCPRATVDGKCAFRGSPHYQASGAFAIVRTVDPVTERQELASRPPACGRLASNAVSPRRCPCSWRTNCISSVKVSGNMSLLVVDDEREIIELLQERLELEGYKVTVATNGKEAFELLRKMDTPCLILLDLMMPVWTGFQFLAAIRPFAELSKIPVVIVSAFPDKAAAAKSVALIQKPIDWDELLQVVKEHC